MEDDHKTCCIKSCNRVLPATTDYFYTRSQSYDGLSQRCIICCDTKMKLNAPEDGHPYKFCNTCEMQLEKSDGNFFVCKNGDWSKNCKQCFKDKRVTGERKNNYPAVARKKAWEKRMYG